MEKIKYLLILIVFQIFIFTSCQSNINDNIMNAIQDLQNIETYGYRSPTVKYDMQASLQSTLMDFDFAINGKGFFKLYDKNNDIYLYSRNGSFKVDAEGLLINSDSYILYPPIKIDTSNYNKFLKEQASSAEEFTTRINSPINEIRKLFPFSEKISVFKSKDNTFIREGNYFKFPVAIEDPESKVLRGLLEMSNIDPITAMLNLERLLSLEEDNGVKNNIKFKLGLIQELRKKYLEIQQKMEFGFYELYAAYQKEIRMFYEQKNMYLRQFEVNINS